MDWKLFKFEYRLDWSGILFQNIVEIEAYKRAASNLVLPPQWRDQLDRLNRIRAVYGTTALEGNPLSESEVSDQLDALEDNAKKSPLKMTKEQRQIRNSGIAQNWVRQRFTPESRPLSLEDIFMMHEMITVESDTKNNIPGRLRSHEVTVGSDDMGGVHRGAPADQLPRLMNEYLEFINSKKLENDLHPVSRALLAHFFLVTLHPFGDGNGRVSRLTEAGILYRHGYNVHGFYGLSNYFYQNEIRYKTLLQTCRRQQPFDLTPLIAFGIEGYALELKGINNFIKTKLNRIVYRNMLVRAFNTRVGPKRRLLNQREYSLLDFLIQETEPSDPFSENPSRKITFSELWETPYVKATYKNVTQRTLGRELIRLEKQGFIKFIDDESSKNLILELDFNAIGKY
jgi:Fic family protein